VTRDEAARLLEQYGAGIDAEVTLLRQLADVAKDQREVTAAANFQAFNAVADRRDAIMRSLVTMEENLRALRVELTAHRDVARQVDGYDEVVNRHREATELVNVILSTDQQSISALADAELARRSAMASLERGETTLAAYRRVLSPPVSSAKLVDKVG
jgi:hypothetical protein